MIYIFGDSHADSNFKGLRIPHVNHYANSITMHRISRDTRIINYSPEYSNSENVFILCYGEVDCRCHIGKQILLGRRLEEICEELVRGYIDTIKKVILHYKHIILCSITPPMKKELYEQRHGPITSEFPFIGKEDERVAYTRYMNKLLKEQCDLNGFVFLDVYQHYSEKDGTLNYQLSDKCVHISDNKYIHHRLSELLASLQIV
jgi:hypothetical protein